MSEEEDTLRLARDKWVPTELAVQMICAVAPPAVNPGQMASALLSSGRLQGIIQARELPTGLHPAIHRRAAWHGKLPLPKYEWNLESLILRLLNLHAVARWPVSAAIILKLAAIEPDQLPALELEKLSDEKRLTASLATESYAEAGSGENQNTDERNTCSDKVTDTTAAVDYQNQSKFPPGKPQKVRGPRPDPLWANVLGWAAGWLAAYGEPPTQAELEREIEARFLSLGKDVAETQIASYAEGLLAGYRAYKKSKSRNSD